jgi:hypothetical protein
VVGAIAIARRAAQAQRDAGSVAGAEVFSTTDVTAFESFGVALQAGLPCLALVALGFASQSIAGELARGTLRNLLLRPLTRSQALLGKALAVLALTCAAYAVLAGVGLGLSALLFDFSDVSEILPNGARFLLTGADALWPELRTALGAPLLPLLAYAAVGFAAGTWARSGATALALALGLGIGLDVSRAVLRSFDLEGLVPSAYLPSPLGDSSFVQYYIDLTQGVSNARFEHAGSQWWVPAAWAVLALALAARVLQRRAIP